MPEAPNTAQSLRDKAERCRRLARATIDATVAGRLLDLAVEFEERAAAAEGRPPPANPA
jgi:hypothetical protein